MQAAIDRSDAWPQTPRGVSVTAVCTSLLLHGLLFWMLQVTGVAPLQEPRFSSSIAVRLVRARALTDTDPSADSVQADRKHVPEPSKSQAQAHEKERTELAAVERVVTKSRVTETRKTPVRNARAVRTPPPPASAAVALSRPVVPAAAAGRSTSTAVSKPSVPASKPKIGVRVTPVYAPTPEYPRLARRLGLEGTVLLRVTLHESGSADDIEIITSSGYALIDDSALAAVRRWQFQLTGERDPATIPSVDVPIRFTLSR